MRKSSAIKKKKKKKIFHKEFHHPYNISYLKFTEKIAFRKLMFQPMITIFSKTNKDTILDSRHQSFWRL